MTLSIDWVLDSLHLGVGAQSCIERRKNNDMCKALLLDPLHQSFNEVIFPRLHSREEKQVSLDPYRSQRWRLLLLLLTLRIGLLCWSIVTFARLNRYSCRGPSKVPALLSDEVEVPPRKGTQYR
jgi:hypothetical protein